MRHRLSRSVLIAGLATLALGAMGVRAEQEGLLLVIPDRYTMVQVAADVAAMKPVTVVSYGSVIRSGSLNLHLWDRYSRQWLPLSEDDFRSEEGFRVAPVEAIVVGTDDALRGSIVDAMAFGVPVKELTSLDTVALLNTVNERTPFSKRQWGFLAGKYDLKLTDTNWERRRYGRYGPPGGAVKRPVRVEDMIMSDEDTVDVQPALEVIEPEKGFEPPVSEPVVEEPEPEAEVPMTLAPVAVEPEVDKIPEVDEIPEVAPPPSPAPVAAPVSVELSDPADK